MVACMDGGIEGGSWRAGLNKRDVVGTLNELGAVRGVGEDSG